MFYQPDDDCILLCKNFNLSTSKRFNRLESLLHARRRIPSKREAAKIFIELQKALSIHVSDTIVHALANCYYQRGYYQQSIELYNTFIKEDSSEIKLNTIAKCYDKLEKPDSALIYRKIIAMQDIENQNNTIALAQNF